MQIAHSDEINALHARRRQNYYIYKLLLAVIFRVEQLDDLSSYLWLYRTVDERDSELMRQSRLY